MHEMSLLENVLEILKENAVSQGYRRVKTVWLEIGKLSCVEPDALRFCFDIVMQGTLAEGAGLEIIQTEGRGECRECGQSAKLASLHEPCPVCGSARIEVIDGLTMRVKELEVE